MKSISISIDQHDGRIAVTSPYHPDFPGAARAAGGRWDVAHKAWTFDARDESRVRSLLLEIYGTDGSVMTSDLVTIRTISACPYGQDWYLAGRRLASRSGRDERVRLGEGVVIITGGFPARGGSAKRPDIDAESGTVLEVRDVPRAAAVAAAAAGDAEIVPAPITDRCRELEEEAARLRERLVEIGVELAALANQKDL